MDSISKDEIWFLANCDKLKRYYDNTYIVISDQQVIAWSASTVNWRLERDELPDTFIIRAVGEPLLDPSMYDPATGYAHIPGAPDMVCSWDGDAEARQLEYVLKDSCSTIQARAKAYIEEHRAELEREHPDQYVKLEGALIVGFAKSFHDALDCHHPEIREMYPLVFPLGNPPPIHL